MPSSEKPEFKGGLPRLPPEAYRGREWIHWSMTIDKRRSGWLDALMHSKIREALLHALCRHHLVCAAYCLMPDHGHFLIGGLRPSPESDQRLAMALFRKEWNRQLSQRDGGWVLQKQAHDHCLRRNERSRNGPFEAVAGYILDNPIKAGLAEKAADWKYLGCLVPGYPDLHPCEEEYWELFWKIYDKLLGEGAKPG